MCLTKIVDYVVHLKTLQAIRAAKLSSHKEAQKAQTIFVLCASIWLSGFARKV
jgi:hypothetical protein